MLFITVIIIIIIIIFSGRSPLWYVPGLTEALDLINQYNPKDDTIELITCK